MHDALTVGIPVLAILFGVFWNNQGLRDSRSELKSDLKDIRADFNRLETKVDRLQADLSQFYRILGEHGARLDNLEKH